MTTTMATTTKILETVGMTLLAEAEQRIRREAQEQAAARTRYRLEGMDRAEAEAIGARRELFNLADSLGRAMEWATLGDFGRAMEELRSDLRTGPNAALQIMLRTLVAWTPGERLDADGEAMLALGEQLRELGFVRRLGRGFVLTQRGAIACGVDGGAEVAPC